MSNPSVKSSSAQPERVKIFDTTLRDGEQAPGFSMSVAQKLEMAHRLDRLGVDVIEAGFAAASPGDFEAIRMVAEEMQNASVCSLARATPKDIEAAARALDKAKTSRCHILLATSPIHREAKLKMTCAEVLQRIEEMVSFAREAFDEIEFSAEDALRTEHDFLIEAMSCAAQHGADVLNLPDTVGYSEPGEMEALYRKLSERVERPHHVIFSTHCHNDLGLAVSNSLAAVKGGARQIECTINGIGERAGNCSLEEVVMALNVRADLFPVKTGVDTTQLWPTSQMLMRLTGSHLAPNKAVVGKNAFAHEAGIHQHGMIADRRTYEIMSAESVGAPASSLVLGKHSGKHALKQRLSVLGYSLEGSALDVVFQDFKNLADTQSDIGDYDLISLVEGRHDQSDRWQVCRVELRSTAGRVPTQFARVELDHPERGRVCDIAQGEGPLAAAFKAVEGIVGEAITVTNLETRMMRDESAHRVQADIEIEVAGQATRGRARGPDTVTAAMDAMLVAYQRRPETGSSPHTPKAQPQTSPSPEAWAEHRT